MGLTSDLFCSEAFSETKRILHQASPELHSVLGSGFINLYYIYFTTTFAWHWIERLSGYTKVEVMVWLSVTEHSLT